MFQLGEKEPDETSAAPNEIKDNTSAPSADVAASPSQFQQSSDDSPAPTSSTDIKSSKKALLIESEKAAYDKSESVRRELLRESEQRVEGMTRAMKKGEVGFGAEQLEVEERFVDGGGIAR